MRATNKMYVLLHRFYQGCAFLILLACDHRDRLCQWQTHLLCNGALDVSEPELKLRRIVVRLGAGRGDPLCAHRLFDFRDFVLTPCALYFVLNRVQLLLLHRVLLLQPSRLHALVVRTHHLLLLRRLERPRPCTRVLLAAVRALCLRQRRLLRAALRRWLLAQVCDDLLLLVQLVLQVALLLQQLLHGHLAASTLTMSESSPI